MATWKLLILAVGALVMMSILSTRRAVGAPTPTATPTVTPAPAAVRWPAED